MNLQGGIRYARFVSSAVAKVLRFRSKNTISANSTYNEKDSRMGKNHSTYYLGFQYIGCTVHVVIEILLRRVLRTAGLALGVLKLGRTCWESSRTRRKGPD